MGLFRKTGEESPDIIYTQEFRLANGSRYLDYMERKEALSPNPEATNDLKHSQNRQADPDMPKHYKGYLGYTDRKAATKMETDLDEKEKGDYPTFTQGAYELTEAQHKKLVANLKEAQKNKALLWAGVISFSPEFIEQSGLMNEDGSINQKAIKTAVMNAMPEYLKAEGINNSQTFWWGDIHLNTNHVHVHLAISQKKNTRPLKLNGEPKGMFHTKSIRKLKSVLHHELANTKSRARILSLERSIDYHRGDMMASINEAFANPKDKDLRMLLVNLQQTLPDYKDKRKWRGSNRSVEFRESRELAYDLIDYLLEHYLRDSYQRYQKQSKELDELAKKAYGQNIKDTIKKRDDKLRERLVNQLFSNLREFDYLGGYLFDSNGKFYRKDSLAVLKKQGPELNQKIIKAEEEALKKLDPASKQAKQVRMRLGFRRYYLKMNNLDQKIANLQIKIDGLEGLGEQTKLIRFKRFYQEQQLMYKLQKLPHRTLKDNPEFRKLLDKLQKKYGNERRMKINQVSPELATIRLKQLETEKQLLKENKSDPGLKYIHDDPVAAINEYERAERVIEIKSQIREDNAMPEAQRRKVNGPLFQELKDLNSGETVKKVKLKHITKTVWPKINSKKGNQQSKSHGLLHNLDGLLESTIKRDRRTIRALHKRLDTDDELEREDELERRREERQL